MQLVVFLRPIESVHCFLKICLYSQLSSRTMVMVYDALFILWGTTPISELKKSFSCGDLLLESNFGKMLFPVFALKYLCSLTEGFISD